MLKRSNRNSSRSSQITCEDHFLLEREFFRSLSNATLFQNISQRAVNESYDPYKAPPDIKLALIHEAGSGVGVQESDLGGRKFASLPMSFYDSPINQVSAEAKQNESLNNILMTRNRRRSNLILIEEPKLVNNPRSLRCPCCLQETCKRPLGLFCKTEDLSFLGYSYVFFLDIIKLMIYGVFLPFFIIIGGMHLVLLCIGIKINDVYVYRCPVDCIFLLYLFIFCRFYVNVWVSKKKDCYSLREKTASKMTVRLSELHPSWSMEEIRTFLNQKAVELNLSKPNKDCVREIHPIYYIGDFVETFLELDNMNLKKESLESGKKEEDIVALNFLYPRKEPVELFYSRINHLFHKREELMKEYSNTQLFHKNRFTRSVFVTFCDSEIKKKFLRVWPQSSLQKIWAAYSGSMKFFQHKGRFVSMQQAPHPNDLIWENLKDFKINKLILRLFTFFILLFLFCLMVGISNYILAAQGNNFGSNMIIWAVILIFTWIIDRIIMKIVMLDYSDTLSKEQSLTIKYVFFFQFFSTFSRTIIQNFFNLLFIILISGFAELDHDDAVTFSDQIILIYYSFTSLLVTISLKPFLWWFHPAFLLRHLKRGIIKQWTHLCRLTQIECNKVFEKVPCNISRFYIELLYLIMINITIVPIYPFWALLSIFAMVFYYWTYKYLLLRSYSVQAGRLEYVHEEFISYLTYMPSLYVFSMILLVIRYTFMKFLADMKLIEFDMQDSVFVAFSYVIVILFLIELTYHFCLCRLFCIKRLSFFMNLFAYKDKGVFRYEDLPLKEEYNQLRELESFALMKEHSSISKSVTANAKLKQL